MYWMIDMYYVVIGSDGYTLCGTSDLATAQANVALDSGSRLLTMESEIDTETEFTYNGETFSAPPVPEEPE